MKCRFCGADPNPFFALPLPYESGSIFSCIPCGIEQGFYCEKHDAPHTYFFKESTACLQCINEMVKSEKRRAPEIYEKIREVFPAEEIARIEEWADLVGSITGDDIATCVLRSVVCSVISKKSKLKDIIAGILEAKSADSIVPYPF